MPSTEVMLREGSFALASFGRIRKVHERAFAVAFGRKSVAQKRILDAAFESLRSPGEAAFADLMDVLLAIAFTPIDRLAFVQPVNGIDLVKAAAAVDGDIGNLTVRQSHLMWILSHRHTRNDP